MRARTAGKIAIGVLTILFAVLAIVYALNATKWPDKMGDAVRAFTAALLALTTATSYRYFED